MNAILGQINVDLNSALPAQVINIKDGQLYNIITSNGQHNPCSNSECALDSWLPTFSAFPNTSNGEGLRAFGITSSRDNFSFNRSNGNYEDTLFGRACFIPPTMIPFSHAENPNPQQQRLNRLTTQAAMYVNGYKRDWFGFNQGALIGSCLLYTSPSPRDQRGSRMPSSA